MNIELIVEIIVVFYIIRGICHIILGMYEHERPTHYDKSDILIGMVMIIIGCYFYFGG